MEIELTFKPDIVDVRRIVFRQRRIVFVGLGFVIVLLCLGAMIFGVFALSEPTNENHLRNFLVMFTVLPFVAGLGFLEWRKVGKLAKELLDISQETRYRFDKDGLHADSESGYVDLKWSSLFKVTETADDFLFFPQRNLNILVSKRSFKSTNDVLMLRTILAENMGKKAKLLTK